MAQQQQAKGDKEGKKIKKRAKRPAYLTLECKASRLRSQATQARTKVRQLQRRLEAGKEQSCKAFSNRLTGLENHAKRSEAQAKALDGDARIA